MTNVMTHITSKNQIEAFLNIKVKSRDL